MEVSHTVEAPLMTEGPLCERSSSHVPSGHPVHTGLAANLPEQRSADLRAPGSTRLHRLRAHRGASAAAYRGDAYRSYMQVTRYRVSTGSGRGHGEDADVSSHEALRSLGAVRARNLVPHNEHADAQKARIAPMIENRSVKHSNGIFAVACELLDLPARRSASRCRITGLRPLPQIRARVVHLDPWVVRSLPQHRQPL